MPPSTGQFQTSCYAKSGFLDETLLVKLLTWFTEPMDVSRRVQKGKSHKTRVDLPPALDGNRSQRNGDAAYQEIQYEAQPPLSA